MEEKELEEMTREELLTQIELLKDASTALTDPYMNPLLTHPDTPTLKKRILDNEVLRLYYRPDLYDRFGTRVRPTEEERIKAFKGCWEDLDIDVVWRTACAVGVNYRNSDMNVLSNHVCVAIFCRLTKADVPFSCHEDRRDIRKFFLFED
jgi:hypothetical protein